MRLRDLFPFKKKAEDIAAEGRARKFIEMLSEKAASYHHFAAAARDLVRKIDARYQELEKNAGWNGLGLKDEILQFQQARDDLEKRYRDKLFISALEMGLAEVNVNADMAFRKRYGKNTIYRDLERAHEKLKAAMKDLGEQYFLLKESADKFAKMETRLTAEEKLTVEKLLPAAATARTQHPVLAVKKIKISKKP